MQIFSNPLTGSTLAAAQPEDAGSTSGSNSSSSPSTADSATITANDFLQLLCTELQNQDPTANTDPNEYINQLVQVNSLEQLISINQDLTPTTSSGTSGSSGSGTGAAGQTAEGIIPGSNEATAASGNLSAPNTGASTSRIVNSLETAAQSLGSGSSASGSSASPMGSMLSSLKERAQQRTRTSTSNPAH
jgi:flagellar basal-body rod modification protein FlgD